MSSLEKFSAFFVTVLIVGMGYLVYKHSVDKANCTQSAITQSYPAEQIRLICR